MLLLQLAFGVKRLRFDGSHDFGGWIVRWSFGLDDFWVNPGETTVMSIFRCALSGEAHSSIRFLPKSEFSFSLLSQFKSAFGGRTLDFRSVSPRTSRIFHFALEF
ncbi:hypothetical protein LINPERPRIM_LOCUS22684 [Linum perenne]